MIQFVALNCPLTSVTPQMGAISEWNLTLSSSHDHFYTLVKVFPGLRGSDSSFILSQTQAENAACPIIAVRKHGEQSTASVQSMTTEPKETEVRGAALLLSHFRWNHTQT